MSDISSLSTQTSEPIACAEDLVSHHDFSPVEAPHGLDPKYLSPPPPIPNELTPPPSSQIPVSLGKSNPAECENQISNTLGLTAPSAKWGKSIVSTGLFGEIPSVDAVQHYNEDQLRGLVAELLPALSEARMSAAHAKLQYSLLSIENAEAMKRAEVEHEMTRREVQVLQENITMQLGGLKPISSRRPQHQGEQRHLDLALRHCREMQTEKALLERKLRRAKKLILRLDGKNNELTEEIELLRLRIKQNRDRFNAMRSSGAISVGGTPSSDVGTPLPRGTPRTPNTARTPVGLTTHVGSQDPFDALLFAGQVLNEETNSVPSTPSRPKPKKSYSSHIRGAHSLSSLPVTPDRARPIMADDTKFSPLVRHVRENRPDTSIKKTQMALVHDRRRHERDSTISASDNEDEAYTDVDIPASQASQRATSMLRLMPNERSEGAAASKSLPGSRKLLQSRLTGQVKKNGVDRFEHRKRGKEVNTYDEISRVGKKAKLIDGHSDKIGLGIANWPNSRR